MQLVCRTSKQGHPLPHTQHITDQICTIQQLNLHTNASIPSAHLEVFLQLLIAMQHV
jgi:hypothetical protein